MKTLTAAFRAEASGDSNKPIELYDLYLDSGTLHFANYDKNISFYDVNGIAHTYLAFPTRRDKYERDVENPINTISMSVANVDRAMSIYLANNDFRGRRVVIRKIFSDQLSSSGDYAFVFDGVIDTPSAAENVIQIQAVDRIGTLKREAPRRWFQLLCNHKFGDDDCFRSRTSGDMYSTQNYTCYLGNTSSRLIIQDASPLIGTAWLTGWIDRIKIFLTGSTGAGTDYPIKLTIGESSGSGTCNFNIDNKSTDFPSAKDDSGDLRFTSVDGATLLDFWVESVSGTTPNRVATVWVEVKDDLSSNTSIYIYFNNSGASNASSATNTFTAFDDFPGSSLDGGVWGQSGSVSVGSSVVTLGTATSWIAMLQTYGTTYALRAYSKLSNADNATLLATMETPGGNNNKIITRRDSASSFWRTSSQTTVEELKATDVSVNTSYHTTDIIRVSSTSIKFYIDEVLKNTHTVRVPSVVTRPGFWNWGTTANVYADWIIVRKMATSGIDPAYLSISSSESQAGENDLYGDDYWIDGEIRMTNGANFGLRRRVVNYVSGDSVPDAYVDLDMSLSYAPVSGDTFTIRRGCDKTHFRCSGDFGNDVNFDGFDTIPQEMVIR